MKRNFAYLVTTLAVMAGGVRVLGSPSINAIGLLSNYIPPVGSGLGGVANCTHSSLNAISPDGQIAVGYVHGDTLLGRNHLGDGCGHPSLLVKDHGPGAA